jgi:hypothetical protein
MEVQAAGCQQAWQRVAAGEHIHGKPAVVVR